MYVLGWREDIAPAMNPALTRKTSLVFAVAVFAFTLGGYIAVLADACAEFKEGGGAWVVIIGCIVGLAASGFALVYDAWRSTTLRS